MPNMRQEQRAAAVGFSVGWAANLRRMIMRFGLLGCAAALTLIGAAAAKAETIYLTEPNVIATAPDYVYSAPGPFAEPSYVVAEPAPVVVAEPPPGYVLAPPVTYAVEAPLAIAPRERVIERQRVVVAPRERVISRERIAPPRDRDARRVRWVAPRERVVQRERVIVAPREEVVVAPRESGIVTTATSSGSCFVDLNGFERCY
jgi:hypothetical protein